MSSRKQSVLIARELLAGGLEVLGERFELRRGGLKAKRSEILDLAAGVEAVIIDPTDPVDEELLAAAGRQLLVVANNAVGYDNVDLEACRRRGVLVTNTPDVLTNATAELALALTLSAARGLGAAESELRAGLWTGWTPGANLGTELSGATFGIVGLGRIGRRYAELVRPLAAELLHASGSPKPDAESELRITQVGLDDLLRRSDFVSLHAPATPQTRHLIDAQALSLMKPSAVLVNTGRGTLVDSAALSQALAEGLIGAAGLDVYEAEPSVPEALLKAPNCVLLPHVGSATGKARHAMARLAAENVVEVLEGSEPLTPVS